VKAEDDVEDVFDHVMEELEDTFRALESQIPSPQKINYGDGFTLRYIEKTPQQAMLQKFARIISGLHCARLLLAKGFLQEMGTIQRTIDDFTEEILFVTLALANDDITEHHKNYFTYHWMEESDNLEEARGMVPRKHIRAYVAKYCGDDPSSIITAGRSIYKSYSGFVHANSQAVTEMCFSENNAYSLNGMTESPFYKDHQDDLWNYMYRGMLASTSMARLFFDEQLFKQRMRSLDGFSKAFAIKIF
jgi:hypothetical protein